MSEKKGLLTILEQLFPRSRMRPVIALQILNAIRIKGEISRWDNSGMILLIATEHKCTTTNVYRVMERLTDLGLLKYECPNYSLGDETFIKQFTEAWDEFLRKGAKLPEGIKSIVEYMEADKAQKEVEA